MRRKKGGEWYKLKAKGFGLRRWAFFSSSEISCFLVLYIFPFPLATAKFIGGGKKIGEITVNCHNFFLN